MASLCDASSLLVVLVTLLAPCHRPGPPTIRRIPCTGIPHTLTQRPRDFEMRGTSACARRGEGRDGPGR